MSILPAIGLVLAGCACLASGAVELKDAPPVAEYAFQEGTPADEALLFTPAGFDHAGAPKVAEGRENGTVRLRLVDASSGKPVFGRVNVVGPDGNYYEPAEGLLSLFSLTGTWPQWPQAWGNRPGKAPFRYLGHYFYCDGSATVTVPAGALRIEAWKGLEYRPASVTAQVEAGREVEVEVKMEHAVSMLEAGYQSGDLHVHLRRRPGTIDDRIIFDLLEAEDIHYGAMLAYNEPAGPYSGRMEKQDSPQFQKLGRDSVATRGTFSILSGQEYRSSNFGHLNLYLLDALARPEQAFDTNNGPAYGLIGREAHTQGGVAIHAHGGYALEIYADVVQGDADAVELLQFGIYRGIGLNDWYHMLNCGFRVAATASSDYPACRKLGDSYTFVRSAPDFPSWIKGAAEGRSFITSGPLVLLEVDGQPPGATIAKPAGRHRVPIKLRVRSEVAPVTTLQLIGNGRLLKEISLPAADSLGRWLEVNEEVDLEESAWIAARAFSLSARGLPDAEAHTNPVRITVNEQRPYDAFSLEVLLKKLDGQIEKQTKRNFEGRAQVLAYFARSREILLAMRAAHRP